MYEICWRPRALRQLRKVSDRRLQARILEAVGRLRGFPAVSGVRRLVDHRCGYRLRVAGYRVLFDVRETIRIVEVQEVRKRDESTY